MKIQIDIPDELNKQMKIYKAKNSFDTLQDVAIELIKKGLENERK